LNCPESTLAKLPPASGNETAERVERLSASSPPPLLAYLNVGNAPPTALALRCLATAAACTATAGAETSMLADGGCVSVRSESGCLSGTGLVKVPPIEPQASSAKQRKKLCFETSVERITFFMTFHPQYKYRGDCSHQMHLTVMAVHNFMER
jgi:hypothetical protein